MTQHTTAYTEDDFHARPRARLRLGAGVRLTLPFTTGQPQSNPTPIKRARHAGYDPLHHHGTSRNGVRKYNPLQSRPPISLEYNDH